MTNTGFFRKAGLLNATIAVVILLPKSASALEVDEVLWGFNGRVTLECFNPLAVLVSNRSANAFDGSIDLWQSAHNGRVGARMREPLYLSPNSSRWVQFYPYVMQGVEEWKLQTSARQSFDLPEPLTAEPVSILISDPDDFSSSSGYLKRFPENLFPAMVGATE